MAASRILLVGAALWAVPQAPAAAFQPAARAPEPPPIVRSVEVEGAQELGDRDLLAAAGVRVGEPLPDRPDAIAHEIEQRYHKDGYTFAEADATFDPGSGALVIAVDEGRIDEIEFTGVEESRARTLADDFALRPGDIFNAERASDALRALLRPSRGAIRPAGGASNAFDLVRLNGRRVLRVAVDERAGAFRAAIDMGEREDWFTPVDGLVPSLGFGGAVFDQKHFNHAFVAGHLSYKMASHRAGYSLGVERPLFWPVTVYLGAELYDLTASDDRWQISGTQASLSAFAARESFRDYYRRRGVQVQSAVRASRHIEFLAGWRGERHEALTVESDFSLWNGDEAFRPNAGAAEGRLNALVFGASYDAIGFDRESLAATYRRHQLETPFGSSLSDLDGLRLAWRADWTTEVSAPGVLGGDFDFRRHVVSGRAAVRLSGHEEFRVRVVGGWSQGTLPPQRLFTLGGIGSVHGYGFKEAVGEGLALVNVEYAIGKLDGPHLAPFFDIGRVGTSTLKGVGFGLGLARELRIDIGFKLDDFPGSGQVLLRLGRTF